MIQLKCPRIESSKHLCDKKADYQIDGIVLCNVHAREVMRGKGNSPWKMFFGG